MFKRFLIIVVTCSTFNCQISDNNGILYYPEESNAYQPIPQNINLSDIRGTSSYERYVDMIIAGGIANLTLAINRVLIERTSINQNNIVFAPMSIGGALALVLLGSNGKTFEEITNVLGLASGLDIQSKSDLVHEQFGRMIRKVESTSGFQIGSQVSFAHAVFVQNGYPIRNLYRQMAEQLYESDVLSVDFQSNPNRAQQTINAWVADRTRGKIKDILADVPSQSTKVIIASAMYFKALWEFPFFEGATVRRPFYTQGRNSPSYIEADMMANGGFFPYYKDPNLRCEIMGFPYKGNATVMYVVMPFDSNSETLKQLESVITAGDLKYLAGNVKETSAVVLFPRMKIESTVDLKAPLEHLGLRSLFDPSEANLALLSPGQSSPALPSKFLGNDQPQTSVNQNSDSFFIFSRSNEQINQNNRFRDNANIKTSSRINSNDDTNTLDKLRQLINYQSTTSNQNPGLFADKIIHKVYMDITETGTEAAASTAVSLSRDGSKVTFRVDVPFFFFIRHEQTKTILFWGSVYQPTPNYRRV